MRTLITGGSGTLGTHVVNSLIADGRATPRVLSRSAGETAPGVERAVGDLDTGAGVRAALDDVDVVLHLAHAGADSTARLIEDASEAGVERVAYIGILGADRIPHPYFDMKVAAERTVRDGAVPAVTLRATQFHAFMDWHLNAMASIPFAQLLLLDSAAVFQTVDEREVAERLVALALNGQDGEIEEMAGPEALTLGEMASAWAVARDRDLPFLAGQASERAAQLPSADWASGVRRALTGGAATATEGAELGTVTWPAYLAASAMHAG